MSIAEPRPPHRSRRARATAVTQILAPAAIVAGLLAAVVAAELASYHGNLTGFVHFGNAFAAGIHPPSGWLSGGRQGYDGQFFFLQAHDPLLLHDSTLRHIQVTGQTFRIQRLGYPLLAWIVSGGQASAIPFALLAVNIMVLVALSAWLAAFARRRGWPTLWALAIVLAPGMLLPVLRDLSDPLSTACVIVAVLSWQERRRLPATVALTGAVITREVMVVVIAAFAAEAAARVWRARDDRGAARAILIQSAPVLVIPACVFGAWHAYVTIRAGGALGDSNMMVPFTNLIAEVRHAGRQGPPLVAWWDRVYVVMIFGAVLLAARAACRGVTVLSATAVALCIGVVLPEFGDFWSDTRLSAPLFAVLLLDGLMRRDRAQTRLGAAASAMTLLILGGI